MDLKGGNCIAFSQSYNNYLERYPDAASELYDAMFEAAGLPADEGTIEEFLQKCSGVTEGLTIREAAKSVDMTGCKCTKCKKGTYQETSQMDDMDGVLHCTNCGMKIDRSK